MNQQPPWQPPLLPHERLIPRTSVPTSIASQAFGSQTILAMDMSSNVRMVPTANQEANGEHVRIMEASRVLSIPIERRQESPLFYRQGSLSRTSSYDYLKYGI